MAEVDKQEEEVTCEDEEPIPLHMMCQQVCYVPEELHKVLTTFTTLILQYYIINESGLDVSDCYLFH